jgi:hypothetical protein
MAGCVGATITLDRRRRWQACSAHREPKSAVKVIYFKYFLFVDIY